MSKLDDFLGALSKVKNHGDYWNAKCPAHDDAKSSLTIRLGDDGESVMFKCHANCDKVAILDALGLGWPDVFAGKGKTEPKIVATYDYTDPVSGEMLYQVVRFQPKDFRQRQPNGKGDWIWNIDGVQKVLFHQSKVVEALRQKEEIWVVEGEKDVLRLEEAGVVATCNAGGAGKWDRSFTETLSGASSIVIVRDKDKAGAEAARFVFSLLVKVAKKVIVVEAASGKDSFDHLTGGLGLMDFLEVDPAETIGFGSQLPLIETHNRELRDISGDAFRAMERGNHPPKVFVMGGNMLATVKQSEDEFAIVPLVGEKLNGIFARTANWVSTKKTPPKTSEDRWKISRKTVFPPRELLADFSHHAPFPGFPRLEGIAKCPILDSFGALNSKAGYSGGGKVWLDIPDDVAPAGFDPAVSAKWIFEEVLCDFPFADDASRAHALALMLVPILRPAIDGPVPLFLLDAPVPGSGKSLLGRIALMPGLGSVSALSAPRDEDEWRKMITMTIISGAQAVFLDNLSRKLDSDALCRALTEPRWSDRILGTSAGINMPLRMVWVATSNNVRVSTDIVRRAIYIRLDPQTDRPELRENFKHENITRWMSENRTEVLSRLLDIVQGWVLDGRPLGTIRMGSFESFAEVVGGVLASAGIEGFLVNREALRDSADDDSAQASAFVGWWWEQFGTEPQSGRQLRDQLMSESQELAAEIVGDGTAEQQTKRMGYWLRKFKDRVVTIQGAHEGADAKMRIVRNSKVQGIYRFKLEIVGAHGAHGAHVFNPTHRKNISSSLFDEAGQVESIDPSTPSAPYPENSGSNPANSEGAHEGAHAPKIIAEINWEDV